MEDIDRNDKNLDGDFQTLFEILDTQNSIKEGKQQNGNGSSVPAMLSIDYEDSENEDHLGNGKSSLPHVPSYHARLHLQEDSYDPVALAALKDEFFKHVENDQLIGMKDSIQTFKKTFGVYNKTLSDRELRGTDKTTVLHKAIMLKNYSMAEYLIREQPDLCLATYEASLKGKTSKKNCLHILVENMEEEMSPDGRKENLSALRIMEAFLNSIGTSSKKNDILYGKILVEPKGQRPRDMTALHMAAMKGINVAVIKFIDKEHMDVNLKNSKNDTPILWAARDNRWHTVQLLLERGANPNEENDKGTTPFYLAVRYNRKETIDVLLSCFKLKITPRKLGLETPIIVASAYGYDAILNKLLTYYEERGNFEAVNEVMKNGGKTALHVAAYYGQAKCLKVLTRRPQPNYNARFTVDQIGDTPLTYAIKGRQLLAAKILLNYVKKYKSTDRIQADAFSLNKVGKNVWDFILETDDDLLMNLVNAFFSENDQSSVKAFPPKKRTPLHVAAAKGDVKRLQLLKGIGVDFNAVDHMGNTILHVAAQNNQIEALKKFKEAVDINAQNSQGDTPLHLACAAGHLDCVQYLCEHAKRNVLNEEGETILHSCVRSRTAGPAVVEYVVDTITKLDGWNLREEKDVLGNTALHVAVKSQRMDILGSLRSLNPKIKNATGETPLHVAAETGNPELMEEMFTIFVAPNSLNMNEARDDGETLLHICAKQGQAKLIERLVQLGADLSAQDNDGNTVLHDLVEISVVYPDRLDDYLEVFHVIIDNAALWWCLRNSYHCPEWGSHQYNKRKCESVTTLLELHKNNQEMSVINLCVSKGAVELLREIFRISHVYRIKYGRDYLYDVTPVTPFTIKQVHYKGNIVAPEEKDSRLPRASKQKSLLEEAIDMEDWVVAATVLEVPPISWLVTNYWSFYSYIFGYLMLQHIALMTCLSIFGINLTANAINNDVDCSNPDRGRSHAALIILPIFYLLFVLYYFVQFTIKLAFDWCSQTQEPQKSETSLGSRIGTTLGTVVSAIIYIIRNLLDNVQLLSGTLFSVLVIAWYALACRNHRASIYVLAVTFIIGWLYTIAFTKGFQAVHAFSIMLKYIIIRDITRWAFIYSFVLLGFAFAFYTIIGLQGLDSATFQTRGLGIYQTFYLLIGMGNPLDDGNNWVRVLYVIYAVLSSIVLLNLLIAMMSDTYSDIKAREGTTWKIGSVRLAIGIEKSAIIGHVFSYFRKFQSDNAIAKNAAGKPIPHPFLDFGEMPGNRQQRYLIIVKENVSENKSRTTQEANITAVVTKLESKINFLGTSIEQIAEKLEYLSDKMLHGDKNVRKGNDQQLEAARPRTGRRISKMPAAKR